MRKPRHASRQPHGASRPPAYRARASARIPALCNDPWAQHLAGEGSASLLAAGDTVAPEMEAGIAVRTAWLDDAVKSVKAPQVVLLGAGLDTRAARLARPGLRFFEVDHPETQGCKRETLAKLGEYPRDASTLVPCDFERDDFAKSLVAAGFDPKQPSTFVWEGVIAYLTEAAVRTTFRNVVGLGATRILFDYIGPNAASVASDGVADFAGKRGEPFIYTVTDIGPLVREEGFVNVEILAMREAHRRQTGADFTAGPAPFFDRWFLADATR